MSRYTPEARRRFHDEMVAVCAERFVQFDAVEDMAFPDEHALLDVMIDADYPVPLLRMATRLIVNQTLLCRLAIALDVGDDCSPEPQDIKRFMKAALTSLEDVVGELRYRAQVEA